MGRGSANEIAIAIETEINSGQLKPGQQLTSVRELSAELDVSPTTVAAAYRRLRDRGLVTGRGRQGTKVAPRPQSGEQIAPTVADGMVDALNGSPDPAHLPNLGPVIASVAAHSQSRYGDPQLVDELLVAGRRQFAADGVDSAHLTVTSGSMDAIERVLHAQGFRTGDRIGVEDPGHIPVHQVARSAGLELVPLPVDADGITVDGLEAALSHGLSAVVITPRAQNPTGAALTTARAEELSLALAPHPSVVLIQDDHAGPIAGTPYVPVTAPGERWSTIRSVGKSFGPDLRLAIVAGDRHTIDRITTAIGNGPGWVSHLLQRVVARLLTDDGTAQQVAEAAASYRHRREQLIEALGRHGVSATGRSGLNVWIPTADEQAAVEAARSAGYAIRAAGPWRIRSGPAVRVTITNLGDDDMERLAEGLGGALTRPSSSQQV